jgi:hypothetical protein
VFPKGHCEGFWLWPRGGHEEGPYFTSILGSMTRTSDILQFELLRTIPILQWSWFAIEEGEAKHKRSSARTNSEGKRGSVDA